MTMLTAEAILNASDLTEATVECPEWGGSVLVRSLTKAKVQELRTQATVLTVKNGKPEEEVDSKKLELLMFIHGVVEPAFSADQVEAIAGKANAPVDRVTKKVLEISGLAPNAVKEAEKSVSP